MRATGIARPELASSSRRRVERGNRIALLPSGRWADWLRVHAQHRGRIFLPFAADDDPKIAEVIAKVLRVANDREVKDPTILERSAVTGDW